MGIDREPPIDLCRVLGAANINLFLVPNQVVSSGVTGIGMLLYYRLGWPVGLATLLLNIPILAAGIVIGQSKACASAWFRFR